MRSLEAAGLVVYAYLIGGIITEARLDVAGLPSGPQALTPIPNGQLVGTGAGALLTWGAVALAFVTLATAAYLGSRLLAKGIVRVKRRWLVARAQKVALITVTALVVLGAVVLAQVDPGPSSGELGAYGWVAIGISLIVGVAILLPAARGNRHASTLASPVALVGAYRLGGVVLLMAAVISTGDALDGPTRFSFATVHEKSGACVTGPLLASTSDGAYLADGVSHSVTLVRAETIETVVVERKLVEVAETRVRSAKCGLVGR